MSKKTVDCDASSDDMNSAITKSIHSLSDNTRKLMVFPNILQNICLSDSIGKSKLIITTI